MVSKKRKEAIKKVISNAFYNELKEIEGPPEVMKDIDKERFDFLSELEASISIQLSELFDSWDSKRRPSMAESQN